MSFLLTLKTFVRILNLFGETIQDTHIKLKVDFKNHQTAFAAGALRLTKLRKITTLVRPLIANSRGSALTHDWGAIDL